MQRTTLVILVVLLASCTQPRSLAVSTSAAGRLAYTASESADRELLPDEQIQQLLNRLAFGGKPGDAALVRAIGVDRWTQLQLNPESIPDNATAKVLALYPTLSANRSEMLAESQQMIQRAVPELQTATLARAVLSDRQLHEVLVNFWENHFSVFANKGQQERLFVAEYDRDVMRPNAMGKFRTLLGAVAHSPAMLFYLDNWQSQADSAHPTLLDFRTAGRPRLRAIANQRPRRGLNENYARELMELHTLGVDGGYSQTDVIEVARALTGWTIAMQQGGGFVFRPQTHDAAPKTVLGHQFAAGRGEDEGEAVLDIVARHPSTARFITTKLARHFVSDDPPKSVVDRCAAVFTKSDGDIRQTVGCIVTGREFFSRAAYRSKVKTPFQVVASALRAVQAEPDASVRAAQSVAQLGQPIFGRQTPDGWPDRADAWMNTGAILGRINFGTMLAGGRVPGVTMGRVPELEALRGASREAQVDGVVKLFFGGQVSADTRQVLLSGENPLAGGDGQMRGRNQPIVLEGLPQVIGLALGAPEFQRR